MKVVGVFVSRLNINNLNESEILVVELNTNGSKFLKKSLMRHDGAP